MTTAKDFCRHAPQLQKPLSWKPVRNGKFYCAPACGGGCLLGDFDRAMAAACACARDLGNGWAPDVYENLGWHWKVTRQGIGKTEFSVHPAYGGVYWASLVIEGRQVCDTAPSAKRAAQIVLQVAADYAGDIINALALIGAPVKDVAIAGGRGQ